MQEIDSKKLNNILTTGNESKALDSNANLHFKLIEDGHEFYKEIKGYGGYLGDIIKAPHYILALTEKRGIYLENLGYRMERLMIKAQELGLGICWIELFFSEERINKTLRIQDPNIEVIAITPMGLEKTTFFDNLIRRIGVSKSKRKPVSEILYFNSLGNNRLPKNNLERNLYKIVDYSRLAPSWGNMQPWQFIAKEDKVIILSELDKSTIAKKKVNYYRIDCGIVMLYFELLANKIGIHGKWELNNSKDNIYKYNIPENYEYIGEFIFK